MLSKEDQDFMYWWQNNSAAERKWERAIRKGLGMGLMLSAPIVLAVLFRGWYKRMPFISGTQLLLILAGSMAVSVFYALLKGRMDWESKEERYQQLQALQKQEHQADHA
jgi:hypothetical protein